MRDVDGRLGRVTTLRAVQAGEGLYSRHIKRALDLLLVLLALPFALPLALMAWVIVRLDGGPGLYGHARVGRNGQVFTCWKIRTMHADAGARLVTLLATDPVAARAWDSHCKLPRDPRVTAIGRVLRRLSIDELPQLWNIARGDMSFVGPRPVTATELDRYGTRRRFYLACRPGLTGLWQVSGRNRLSYEERVTLDQRYAEHIGLLPDLLLLLRTVPAVLGLTGA